MVHYCSTRSHTFVVMDQNNETPKIAFKGEEFQTPARVSARQTPKMVRWVMNISQGYVRNEQQATLVLIGFVVVVLVATVFVWATRSASDVQNETRILIDSAIKETNAPR